MDFVATLKQQIFLTVYYKFGSWQQFLCNKCHGLRSRCGPHLMPSPSSFFFFNMSLELKLIQFSIQASCNSISFMTTLETNLKQSLDTWLSLTHTYILFSHSSHTLKWMLKWGFDLLEHRWPPKRSACRPALPPLLSKKKKKSMLPCQKPCHAKPCLHWGYSLVLPSSSSCPLLFPSFLALPVNHKNARVSPGSLTILP